MTEDEIRRDERERCAQLLLKRSEEFAAGPESAIFILAAGTLRRGRLLTAGRGARKSVGGDRRQACPVSDAEISGVKGTAMPPKTGTVQFSTGGISVGVDCEITLDHPKGGMVSRKVTKNELVMVRDFLNEMFPQLRKE